MQRNSGSMMWRCRGAAVLLLLAVTASGCARYEYSILQPQTPQPVLTKKQDVLVPMLPLEYRFRVADDHLYMGITNTSGQLVTMLGHQSYVVDTQGQSHPLPTRSIAPHSYITLTIPPVPPVYRVDYGAGWYPYAGYPYGYSPWGPGYYGNYWGYWTYPPGPAYITLDTPTDYYWEWPRPGEFRLNLTFEMGDEKQPRTTSNSFVFLRRKL